MLMLYSISLMLMLYRISIFLNLSRPNSSMLCCGSQLVRSHRMELQSLANTVMKIIMWCCLPVRSLPCRKACHRNPPHTSICVMTVYCHDGQSETTNGTENT